eukprot:NODE_704_length_1247_cov_277.709821_g665_i0.p1 GENE.NODE_704_length_1247_cov_277.709821_g665_i0~~NODE_704_length_1247_cov_277.709821_g665_i0.p1  ORF type:complete len:323 (+),score=92.75 NODE_704_length_1247_cov_277.709821_g665_i0:72-1040(+)
MKCVLVVALLAIAVSARSVDDDLALFDDFKNTYGRKYAPSEDVHRFNCFRRNLVLIDERNARGAEQHGVNQFTDLCPEEFAHYYLGFKMSNSTRPDHKHVPHVAMPAGPSSVDWRTKGAVTPIKNQGMCGSCWSFSATGNMEGQWFLGGHTLVGLSEEELVQCDHDNCFGCRGGLMDNAFDWVVQNGGIDSESDYPYTSGGGITGTCDNGKLSNHVAKITGHYDIPSNEGQMSDYLAQHGPVSIAVDAMSWQTYTGGIMQNCMGTQLDHGVLAVGYDKSWSTPYWIVKNSWGTSWGENGYIRLQYGTNQCNLDAQPSSSIVG